MTFSLTSLAEQLAHFSSIKHFHVAFSGGLDSSVLLHAMAALREHGQDWSLSAIHVHHGLHAAADDWAQFCQQQCQYLHIPCELIHVDARPVSGASPEATARELRYQAMAGIVSAGQALLTAHHQDDQAETLLLQLMRGSGLPGLAAMPVQAPFSHGLLLRPLLGFSRQQLREYALQQQIDWVEDSSNDDIRYDRNFMRHEILPQLSNRWPGLVANLCRTSVHMSEAMQLLQESAAQDLQQVVTDERSVISAGAIAGMSAARQRNLLRHWLRSLGLPVPSQAQMQRVIDDCVHAAPGSAPCVTWPGVELRAYRQQLYAMKAMACLRHDGHIGWDLRSVLRIEGVGTLRVTRVLGQGMSATLLGHNDLSVRFRRGGERIRPAHRGHEHELKKLFQEAAVPPWQRERTPILYQGEDIVAVAGVCESESCQAAEGEPGLLLHWDKHFD